jgi:hypothetical protein
MVTEPASAGSAANSIKKTRHKVLTPYWPWWYHNELGRTTLIVANRTTKKKKSSFLKKRSKKLLLIASNFSVVSQLRLLRAKQFRG